MRRRWRSTLPGGGRTLLRLGPGPARWLGCAVTLLLTALVACSPEPPSDPELRQALGIEDARPIHRINLGGRGSIEHVVPVRVVVLAGDLVQFVMVDRRVHTITFRGDGLSPAGRAFLEETGQISSPPLLQRGARFVVSFEHAPAGEYPFVSEGNGDPAAGSIVVVPETP